MFLVFFSRVNHVQLNLSPGTIVNLENNNPGLISCKLWKKALKLFKYRVSQKNYLKDIVALTMVQFLICAFFIDINER